jgi:two-component system sensor histidine kinase CpxA
MRSIFLKIFVSFWLVQALFISLALLTAERPSERAQPRWRSLASDALALYGQEAVAMLEQGQGQRLPAYFEQTEQAAEMHLFLFDARGEEVSGHAPPAGAIKVALLVNQSGRPEVNSVATAAFVGRPLRGTSGARYAIVAGVPRGPLRRPSEFISRLALGMLISGIVCFWLARYLTSPIVKLRAATQQLASGDLTARARENLGWRRDEIVQLVHDFNYMAERLESLVKAQRQLISDISHELRSPLSRLNVALGLARQRAGSESTAALDRIELESERLNGMIEKLLTLARLESGDEVRPKSLVQIGDLVREVVKDASFEARSRNCDVEFVSAEECTAVGNPELLRSAIENVVRNAIRYASEGAGVEISLSWHPAGDGQGHAVIRVRDHGPGVPEAEIENLVRPFYRLDASRERNTGGIGLGLAITSRAVRAHGGTLTAANAPSGGLVVEIRLPSS